jgi:Holliday junction resolvase RusA-like endonuclease
MRITVIGTPAPQGSKKFVGRTKDGRGIMAESSKKVRPWRQDVKAAGEAVMNGRAPLDCALMVRMTFTLPKPASAPKTRKTWPDRKPDASKLARSTEDALVEAGVMIDDARIVCLVVHKRFPNEGTDALHIPGCVIEVARADGQPIDIKPVEQLTLV